MKKEKGFSLIELLGVIIIIGLILIIVIPAVGRLISANSAKQYNNYFEVVKVGAIRYSDSIKDDLGSYNDIGCKEIALEGLIDKAYIKEYNDTKITCSGIVRLNNNRGNLKVSIDMTCTNAEGEVTFEKKQIDGSSCLEYTQE